LRYLSGLAVLFLFCLPKAQAQDMPAGDLGVSYSFFREGITDGINDNGGTVAAAANLKPWVGLVGELGIYHANPIGGSFNTFTYLFGPRFSYRSHSRVTPFAQVLLGGAHIAAGGGSANGFGYSAGGGLDFAITRRLAFRPQFDYIGIRSGGSTVNSLRASAGIVFGF
jgi:opacity protein-like surface antigen